MDSAKPALPRIKRHILVVKRSLQAKIILLVAASVLLAVALVGWDIYHTFGKDVVRELMDPSLYELFQRVGRVLIAKLIIYMAVVVLVALFISHKLAGPLYRFEQSARCVAEGDLTHRVYLRSGDEMADLQDEFNAMVQSLHDKVAKDHHLAHRVSKRLAELMQAKDISPETLKRLQEIKAEVDHLTSGFKI